MHPQFKVVAQFVFVKNQLHLNLSGIFENFYN